MLIKIRHHESNDVLFTYEPAHGLDGLSGDRLLGYAVAAAVAAKIDLSMADLSGADVTALDLSGADISGAYLRDADLSEANLAKALLPPGVPIVPDIDKAILAEIEAGGELRMMDWHYCETAHCRAGWAIHLAGEAGSRLEKEIGPCAAGALIYAASRPDKPVPDFYAPDDEALEDLRQCANATPGG